MPGPFVLPDRTKQNAKFKIQNAKKEPVDPWPCVLAFLILHFRRVFVVN
jgi:hypothetical protein